MSKTKEKKKRTTGFKLGLTQAICYLVAAFILIVVPVIGLAIDVAETASFINSFESMGGCTMSAIDWNNDGSWEPDAMIYVYGSWEEDYGKAYIRVLVDVTEEGVYEYEYYDFVSENMHDKVWMFESRKTGEQVTVNFTQVELYERYLRWVENYSVNEGVFYAMIAIGGVAVVIAALQFLAAFKGGKSYHANNLGIVLNTILFGFGIFGFIGAIMDRKFALATDEKYIARKQAKDQKKLEKAEREKAENEGSTFTGGAFANAGINWLTGFVCLITLGLAYPAMACWKLRWKCRHTFISGRQLVFDGKAAQFLGKYLLWLFLSIITLGIYYVVCMKVAVAKWQTKHTHFADTVITKEDENLSDFNGHWFQLLGVNWLCRFVTFITLSFGSYWAHCYKERWFCKHKTVDGLPLKFDGRAVQYFGKCILWKFLTAITLGIYGFWLAVKTEKWTCSHTKIDEDKILGNK